MITINLLHKSCFGKSAFQINKNVFTSDMRKDSFSWSVIRKFPRAFVFSASCCGLIVSSSCGSNQKTVQPGDSTLGGAAAANVSSSDSGSSDNQPNLRVKSSVEGKVVFADPTLRYVVVDFLLNPLPGSGARYDAYRNGKRVGAVEIGKFSRDTVIAADMVEGEILLDDRIIATSTNSN